ncbi:MULTISPECIES: hypothetical protein [unclassified Sphingopyxis]|uniref:hypothetical protein n=1 Tax=unclassified Sphingopyxis TaxID=2614943 RepID=UPI0025F6E4E1|nr:MULTISPECIES: hypothetical protein [unclassified Sphingopyxis]
MLPLLALGLALCVIAALLALRLALGVIGALLLTRFAALLAHLAALHTLGTWLRLLPLDARFAAAIAAAYFGTARSTVAAIAVAALRQLYALA